MTRRTQFKRKLQSTNGRQYTDQLLQSSHTLHQRIHTAISIKQHRKHLKTQHITKQFHKKQKQESIRAKNATQKSTDARHCRQTKATVMQNNLESLSVRLESKFCGQQQMIGRNELIWKTPNGTHFFIRQKLQPSQQLQLGVTAVRWSRTEMNIS